MSAGSRRMLGGLAAVYGALLILLGVTFLASRMLDRPMEYFSQDPTETLDAPAYTGFLSSIAALLWAATAASCFLAWLGRDRSLKSPFLWSTLFVLVLLADDVFRLHESYYPSLGVPEPIVPIAYAIAGGAYVWFFRGFIAAHGAWLFVGGAALLGLSAATDQIMKHDAPFAVEEAAKLFGIATWMVFYARAAVAWLRDTEETAAATDA